MKTDQGVSSAEETKARRTALIEQSLPDLYPDRDGE